MASKAGNNFENSFQLNATNAINNILPIQSAKPHASTVGLFSANKQRPTSSNKSALMVAAGNLSSSKQQNPKKKTQQVLRKSVNSTLMNQSANYGHLSQNAYDFLANASLLMNTGKNAARRPKGSSGIDSRCSQNNKDHVPLNGLAKSQITSNTAFGVPIHNLNNTSHTTICSNRKQINQSEIVSGKKNSIQHQIHQNYMSLAGGGAQHTQDAGEISSDRQTLKMNDFLKQIEAYSNDKLDKFMPSLSQAQHLTNILGSSSSMGHNTASGSVASNYGFVNQQAKIAEQVKAQIDKEMQGLQQRIRTKRRYPQSDDHDGAVDDQDDEDLQVEETPVTSGEGQGPDYEHLLNVISDSFNRLISTFYINNTSGVIGASLSRVKESYEEIINSIVENLSQQIENLSLDNESLAQENLDLKQRNDQLEKMAANQERSSQQITSFVQQNEELEKEVRKLNEENKILKREQRDKEGQLIETRKMIEKLSASQKHLASQGSNLNNNSQISSKTATRIGEQNIKQGVRSQVPPLDLGKLSKIPPQVQQPPLMPPLLSNDSLDTLNKGLINANLPDLTNNPSEIPSAFMNTVPNHDGSRMLEELYQEEAHAPFIVNDSEISYQNSDEDRVGDRNQPDNEAAFLSGGGHPRAGIFSDTSSIAQDKSPLQKPFIPPLNLAGLNNRQQAAAQSQQQQQVFSPPLPQKQNPNFKLDVGQVQQFKSPPTNQQDQDTNAGGDYHYKTGQPIPQRPQGALGLNLTNLKQQKGIVDFHDEFMAKIDEYSESWRAAMRKEKRF